MSIDSETRARENLSGKDSHPVSVSNENFWRKERRDPLTKPSKNQKPNKNEHHDLERIDPLYSAITEWMQEFRENLRNDRVPERRDSQASSSREPSVEPTPTRNVDLSKHSVYTHFPKDRNCVICQRTKITRTPCRRRTGRVVPQAEKFWWLDNSRSQGAHWMLWISRQSSICSRGARLGHAMDLVESVQNFEGNTKKLAKVLGARWEAWSHLHW